MTEFATMNTLQNAIHMVSGKEQSKANKMGDAFSKKESLTILKSVTSDYDAPVRALQAGVTSLYLGAGMFGAGPRKRKAVAAKLGITGWGFFVDNVGRVGKCFLF